MHEVWALLQLHCLLPPCYHIPAAALPGFRVTPNIAMRCHSDCCQYIWSSLARVSIQPCTVTVTAVDVPVAAVSSMPSCSAAAAVALPRQSMGEAKYGLHQSATDQCHIHVMKQAKKRLVVAIADSAVAYIWWYLVSSAFCNVCGVEARMCCAHTGRTCRSVMPSLEACEARQLQYTMPHTLTCKSVGSNYICSVFAGH